ncbi:MAG TPA: hypothetical protein VFF68_03505, partial [Anaerolineaceae bacterium]|nr:hypothetical protein [Anaerolineaceae bacterium]
MTSHPARRPGSAEESLAVILRPFLAHITRVLHAVGCLILLRDPQTDMFLIVASTEEITPGPNFVV